MTYPFNSGSLRCYLPPCHGNIPLRLHIKPLLKRTGVTGQFYSRVQSLASGLFSCVWADLQGGGGWMGPNSHASTQAQSGVCLNYINKNYFLLLIYSLNFTNMLIVHNNNTVFVNCQYGKIKYEVWPSWLLCYQAWNGQGWLQRSPP